MLYFYYGDNMENRKVSLSIIGIAILVVAVSGLTLAFFNYTRTGSSNNFNVGRIYFNSEQNGSLNMTNIFPMTSTQASTAQLDTVTVNIVGDTTYPDGEEFEISLVNVTNTINNKQIPINYIATYTATTGNSIGEEGDTYWESRESKNANIYTLEETGEVEEGEQVLVGYIKSGETGINGTLTIKAYIDADRIAISDTYPEGTIRNVITTGYSSSNCETALTGVQNASTYCASIEALQEAIDNEDLTSEEITLLVNTGIIEEYTNGTTSNWVNGRTVFTTEEWNSFATTPISFKIRAESNEGIWVEEPAGAPTMQEMCPDCVFAYTKSRFWTTWNTDSQTPSVLTSSDYYENYEDVITGSGKNYFLGLKLNGSNQIEKAYACGLYNGTMPFCIEGYSDGTKYEANKTILQDAGFWNNTCNIEIIDEGTPSEYEETYCAPPTTGLVGANASSDGYVDAVVDGGDYCRVFSSGVVRCTGPK